MQHCSQGRIVTYHLQVGSRAGKWLEVESEHVFPNVDELLESCGAD